MKKGLLSTIFVGIVILLSFIYLISFRFLGPSGFMGFLIDDFKESFTGAPEELAAALSAAILGFMMVIIMQLAFMCVVMILEIVALPFSIRNLNKSRIENKKIRITNIVLLSLNSLVLIFNLFRLIQLLVLGIPEI